MPPSALNKGATRIQLLEEEQEHVFKFSGTTIGSELGLVPFMEVLSWGGFSDR